MRTNSKTFNEEVFGNIFLRKNRVEGRLRGVQRELNYRVTSDMVRFEAELQGEYRNLLKQEELLWYQKARENTVRFGDRNTSYFHTHAVIRRKRNRIHRLKLDDGTWCTDNDGLIHEIQTYFQSLFAEDTTAGLTDFPHESFPMLSGAAKMDLDLPVSKEEVRVALMAMRSFSAPGPDGFQPFFFKKFRDVVGEDLWKVVSNAFETGTVDSTLLETLIVLIPKVESPTMVKEFRPISLCNVTYKVITKVMVNRIRPYLNSLIGPMQSNFLPGRGTMDNAFLA